MPVFLSTPRLELRPHTSADAVFMVELNADPEVVRYTGDGPLDLNSARKVIDYLHQCQHPFGVARLVVEHMGAPIGWCGLRRLETGDVPDLGYRFFRRVWGQGFATEAAAAVLDHGFSRDDIHKVRAAADPHNTASLRVMKRLGMHWVREWSANGSANGSSVEYTLEQDVWRVHRLAVLARLDRSR